MKRVIFTIGIILIALVADGENRSRLEIYCASKQASAGLHEAKFEAFPNLGYIGDKPDLTISHLEGVKFGPARAMRGAKKDEQPPEDKTVLVLQLTKEDGDALKELTSKHITDRLLMMVNGEPLFAPEIRTPSSGREIYITPPTGSDTAKFKATLETLVRK